MEIFKEETILCHPNGQISFKSVHIGGLVDVKEWYSTGRTRSEYTRDLVTLKFVGIRKEYYENGNIQLEIPYNSDGLVHGIQRGYTLEGKLVYEMAYKNGVIVEKRDYM
jgi:antitoxin component YwqK of YwqJK toxin-antitoxin module